MKVTDLYSEFWTPAYEKLFWAQAIASQYSESTRKKWWQTADLKKYLSAAESTYYRRALAYTLYLQEEMERSAEAKAHFAVGIFSTSLMEALLVLCFLHRKTDVLITKVFAEECSKYRRRKQRRPSFLELIGRMEAENSYRLAREIKLIETRDIPKECFALVKEARYSADVVGLLKYLRDCRNNVHFNNFAGRIQRVIPNHAVDPRGPLDDYHYNFAFIAIRVRNIIAKKSNLNSLNNGLLVRPF
ncbi:MAG: hypothetical protein ABSA39_15855 [Edaphobacter sp.]